MKRLLPLLLAAILLLSGCVLKLPLPEVPEPTETPEPSQYPLPTFRVSEPAEWAPDDGVFTLRYDPEDTLNPFSCSTEANRLLCGLLFEPLVDVDAEFQPGPGISSEWIMEEEGQSFLFRLRNNVRFSDGSALSPWDVIYSVNRAMESTSVYASRLSVIRDVSLSEDGVRITLSSPRPGLPSLLDIPIVKEGTAYRDVPVGTGAYVWERDELGTRLVVNALSPKAKSMPFESIALGVFSQEDLPAALTSGRLDVLTSAPGVVSQAGVDGAVRRSVPTTILHYLAVNTNSEPLADPGRRRLVSALINRGAITGVLGGDATLLPLHPLLPEYDEKAAREWLPTDIADYCIEILTEDYDEDGVLEYFRDGLPTDFTFRLLVCSENESSTAAARSIAEILNKNGIIVELRMLSESDFLKAVSRRDYDMYLAAMRLTADFDLTALCGAAGNDMMQELNDRYLRAAGEDRKAAALELCAYTTEYSSLIPLVFERRVYYRRQGAAWDFEPTWTDPFRGMTARPAD